MRVTMARVWFLAILLTSLEMTMSQSKKKIFIGALVLSWGQDKFGHRTAMELATEIINNRTDILKDYEIVTRFADTHGDPGVTVHQLFNFFQWPKSESMQVLIGPVYVGPVVLSAVACVFWNTVQISYGYPSLGLITSNKFQNLFTSMPSPASSNNARVSLIKYFRWKRIAILQEFGVESMFESAQYLKFALSRFAPNVSIITSRGVSHPSMANITDEVERLKKLDARIIILDVTLDRAVDFFCEAYRMGMYGPKYVWILSFELTENWIFSSPREFSAKYKDVKCNISEVAKAAEGFLGLFPAFIRPDMNKTTFSGLTANEFLDEMHRRHGQKDPASYAFDAIWAAAIMLNKTLSGPAHDHPENFVFGSVNFSQLYTRTLRNVTFEGISGPLRFFDRQRLGIIQISQMRLVNGVAQLFPIGHRIDGTSKLVLETAELKRMWKDGKVPVDGSAKESKVLTYPQAQLIITGLFAVLGLIYSSAFLYFNISKRNCKVVRMSSPMINNVVLLGCSLCYVYVVLLGIDSRFVGDNVLGIMCNVRLYVLAIAFSMSFGALFSKTWRVHKIFTAQRAIKRKMMRDVHLILFVLVLVLIDVVFITLWVCYDPLKPEDIVFDELIEHSEDLITTPVLKICECTHRKKLLGALYGYKGMLLLFGVFLAWATRNVTIPTLNDSKYIGMSIYNVVILSTIGATVSVVLKKTQYYQLLHVLVSFVVILSATVTLSMVFLPKVREYHITRSQPEERIRTLENLQSSGSATATSDSDAYEMFVKKNVKHQSVQTENPDEASCDVATAQVQ